MPVTVTPLAPHDLDPDLELCVYGALVGRLARAEPVRLAALVERLRRRRAALARAADPGELLTIGGRPGFRPLVHWYFEFGLDLSGERAACGWDLCRGGYALDARPVAEQPIDCPECLRLLALAGGRAAVKH